MVFLANSRTTRALAAVVIASALGLTACSSEEVDTSVESAVGLSVDAPRVTLQSSGTGTAEVLGYRDITEESDTVQQEIEVEVSEGFDQTLVQADAVDVAAPAGGEVQALTLPLSGSTLAAEDADPDNEERAATRDVELILGEPAITNLELTEDVRSAEGFTLGWRAEDNGEVSTVRVAAPVDATDTGRAIAEQALFKLLSLPIIFPEEELAPGAVWTVDSRVTGEATLLQTTTYTLASVDGDTVELDVEVQQRPALGALELDGQEGAEELTGQTLSVLNSNTTSEGSLTVDLTKPLPVDGSVAFTTRVIYGGADSDVRIVQDSTTALTFG
ncbi:DUF6263 family protein [Corynebacterium alimapuense]|uniref:Uncharacterized protein n=1 Tax=Corynebacterium alimapuense TaxID=1576874 RepID=A0A3M8K9K5_9CORY|nr:DUF6263 family protein [Corynebacterium alimapuense]RNE49475.1 hypothetical protein C5L39_03725 [Corynebacterium alimapuense]